MIRNNITCSFALISVLVAGLSSVTLGQHETNPKVSMMLGQENSSKIIGKDVKNKGGENLGDIQDLVFSRDGHVCYAVLSFGGFLGMGDKLFAIPWESLKAGPDKTLILDIDQERLKSAPGFNKATWPDMANAAWSTEIHQFYATTFAADRTWGGKAHDLQSGTIKNASGQRIASVKDIVVDLDHGRATMVIVHMEKSVEPKDRWLAIPWNSLTVVPKDDSFTLISAESVLAKAPNFTSDKWPAMDRPYVSEVYRHFGRNLDMEMPVGQFGTVSPAPSTNKNCCRASDMVGAACRTTGNESLGTVKDLVFASDRGQIAFLVVDTAADDGKFRAVPWSLCTFSKSSGVVVSCDAALLNSGPSFLEKDWPNFTDRTSYTNIFNHFGVQGEHLFTQAR